MATLIVQSKRKKTVYAIIAIVIVACLIAAGAYVYVVFYNKKEETTGGGSSIFTPDNRISPLCQQGLIFEINRMRDRSLLDKIMKPGISWREKPQFYFITNMDGLEYISKDVTSAGGTKTQQFFTSWDTMFQESKVVRDVKSETETSEVTLTIMQREKTGLLGLRYQDTEKEKITLTYNYKTGHWTGDDSLNDSDGYGHYIGQNFEVWFNLYQTDYNHDGIPYWTEVNVYHLDPTVDHSQDDPNHDGIPIPWDWKYGYDPFAYDNHSQMDPDKDGLTNLEEYKMQKYFADPFHQDIYIESDGMERGGLFDPPHVFWEESQQIIIERFAEHNINLYIDNGWPGDTTNGGGELLPHVETLSQDSGMMLQFYKNHFADDRKGIFRYLVIGHNAGFCDPSVFNRYDTMAVDTSLYKLLLKRQAFTPRTQRLVLASAVMHELGHSLGIAPWTIGGNDNLSFAQGKQAKQDYINTWGNYKSVMNYYWIWDKHLVDYSDGSRGSYDQNDWKVFDLTFFKKECNVIEEPGFTSPPAPPPNT